MVLAPLPISLGEIQQMVATALQRREMRRVDRPSLFDYPASVAQLHRHRRRMDGNIGWPKDGPEVVAILTQPLRGRRSFGQELVGPNAIATPGCDDRACLQQGAVDRQMGGRGRAESGLKG